MTNLLKKLRSIYLINRLLAWTIKNLKAEFLYPKWPLKGNLKLKVLDENLVFYSNCDDYLISGYYYKGYDEEVQELEVLNRFAKDARVFFDIGSYNGLFSIVLGKKHSDLNVYSFEPNPTNFSRTQRNIDENQLKNIYLNNLGVSCESGSIDFYIPQNESLTTVSSFDSSFLRSHSNSESKNIKIETISIDEFCLKYNLTPDILKIDVEGHEYEVVKGGMKIIERYKPIILCEIFTSKFQLENDFKERLPKVYYIDEVFRKLNYNIFTIHDSELQKVNSLNAEQAGRNFLFIPNK